MDKPTESYPKILLGNRPQTLTELYTNRERWLKCCSAQDARNNSVEPTSPKAVRWCVTGAIALLWDDTPKAREVSQTLLAWIQAHSPEGEEEPDSIQAWNDDSERQFKDIRKVIVELGI